jgi:hypothetical protein
MGTRNRRRCFQNLSVQPPTGEHVDNRGALIFGIRRRNVLLLAALGGVRVGEIQLVEAALLVLRLGPLHVTKDAKLLAATGRGDGARPARTQTVR